MPLRKPLLFLFVVLMLVSCASASVYISSDQIRVYNEGHINLTTIESKLNQARIVSHVGTVWYLNKTINADGSIVHFESPEATEVRITASAGKSYIAQGGTGGYVCNNVTVTGWVNTSARKAIGSERKRFLSYSNSGDVKNTIFQNISRLELKNFNHEIIDGLVARNNSEYVKIYNAHDLELTNCEVYDGTASGIYLYNVSDSEIHNIYIHDVGLIGINSELCTGNFYHDIRIVDAGNYAVPNTGSGGFYLLNHQRCYGQNISVNGSGWSGFAPGGSYGNWTNISVINSGHNSFDFHNIKHTVVTDIYADSPVDHNFLFTAGLQASPSTENITVENFRFVNAGMALQTNISDITLINGTLSGTGGGIITASTGAVFRNVTQSGADRYITVYNQTAQYATDTYIVNCNTTEIEPADGINTRLVNTKYSSIDVLGWSGAYYSTYYPINIIVVNATGYPVKDVAISVSSTLPSVNMTGTNDSIAYTDLTGKLNTTEQLYVPDLKRHSAFGYTYYTQNVTATKRSENDTETGINPNSTWYSSDLSTLDGQLYTLVLDVPGEIPDIPINISSFTPTDTTPTVVNGSITSFTANLSSSGFWEALVNGTVMSNGTGTSAAYNYTASATGSKNITIRTDDDQQTWIVTITEATGFGNPVFTGLVFFGASGAFAGLIFLNQRRKRGAS